MERLTSNSIRWPVSLFGNLCVCLWSYIFHLVDAEGLKQKESFLPLLQLHPQHLIQCLAQDIQLKNIPATETTVLMINGSEFKFQDLILGSILSCETLDQLLHLFKPQFPPYSNRDSIASKWVLEFLVQSLTHNKCSLYANNYYAHVPKQNINPSTNSFLHPGSLSLISLFLIKCSPKLASAAEKGISSESQQKRPLWFALEPIQKDGIHEVLDTHKKAHKSSRQAPPPCCRVVMIKADGNYKALCSS